MASNFWALYMIAYKTYLAIPILYARYVTKVKTESLSFKITDFSFYKKISLYSTLIFMLPLIYKMIRNINKKNFCEYLAIVNLVSYNFGYHVHEKAILMTYLPLLLAVRSQLDRYRIKLVGFIMVWTFLPLIPGEFEAMIKNCMLALHIIQMEVCLPESDTDSSKAFSLKMYRLLLKISFGVVALL